MLKSTKTAFFVVALSIVSSAGWGQAATESTDPSNEVLQFQNWSLRCVAVSEERPKTCTLAQRITTEQGKPLLSISVIFLDPGKDASIIYNVPLGIGLQSALKVEVEDKNQSTFSEELQYTHCNRQGCYAYHFLDQQRQDLFIAGRTLNVSFSTLQNEKVNIPTSLIGFTDGFNALRESGL